MRRQILLLLFALLCCPLAATAEELAGVVSWIHDGDTIEIRAIGRVRLLGVDTPEMEHSSRDDFYLQNFGIAGGRLRQTARQAKKYLIDKIKGEYVELELGSTEKDKYGRYLAYVYLPDGEMLNRILLEKGYASVFRRFSFSKKTEFLNVEKEARNAGAGLWRDYK